MIPISVVESNIRNSFSWILNSLLFLQNNGISHFEKMFWFDILLHLVQPNMTMKNQNQIVNQSFIRHILARTLSPLDKFKAQSHIKISACLETQIYHHLVPYQLQLQLLKPTAVQAMPAGAKNYFGWCGCGLVMIGVQQISKGIFMVFQVSMCVTTSLLINTSVSSEEHVLQLRLLTNFSNQVFDH